MKNKKRFFISSSLLILTVAFFFSMISRKDTLYLDENIEALASGDHYSIVPCWIRENGGNWFEYANFCDFNDPYTISDCIREWGECGPPYSQYECVFSVDNWWWPYPVTWW